MCNSFLREWLYWHLVVVQEEQLLASLSWYHWLVPVLGVHIYIEHWKIIPIKLIIRIQLALALALALSIEIQISTGFPVQIFALLLNTQIWINLTQALLFRVWFLKYETDTTDCLSASAWSWSCRSTEALSLWWEERGFLVLGYTVIQNYQIQRGCL